LTIVTPLHTTVYAVEYVYTVKSSLNPQKTQCTFGDSGKFEHTDYSNKFYVSVDVLL